MPEDEKPVVPGTDPDTDLRTRANRSSADWPKSNTRHKSALFAPS